MAVPDKDTTKFTIKFYRVDSLPTSGYVTGGVYFVTGEKTVYVRTADSWVKYDGDLDTKLLGKADNEITITPGGAGEAQTDTVAGWILGLSDALTMTYDGMTQNGDAIAEINKKIPTEASSTNQLADKAYVDNKSLSLCVNTTWSELVALRDASGLTAGQHYRITDFVTTTVQEDTQSAGHAFDVIVRADDVNVLNENAWAAIHSGDTYFEGCKLEAWKLGYCLDNDTNRFAWADSINGKGVIYRMIDEWNNDLPYDFKNIQYKRYKCTADTKGDFVGQYIGCKDGDGDLNTSRFTFTTDDFLWCYTFTDRSSEVLSDVSLSGSDYNNKIPQVSLLPNIVMGCYCYGITCGSSCSYWTCGNSCSDWTCGSSCSGWTCGNSCSGWTCGSSCSGWTCRNSCSGWTCGSSCSGWTCRNSCSDWTCGSSCSNWTCGDGCSWTCGNYCDNWTCGNYCDNWTCGNYCGDWTCGNYCGDWTCGNSCGNWTCGSSCRGWTCGNYCIGWTCGSSCSGWTCGSSCHMWTCGNSCTDWTCGNSCTNWTCGNSCTDWTCGNFCFYWATGLSNSPLDYVRAFHLEDYVQNVYISSSSTPTSSQILQNFTVKRMRGSSSSSRITITIDNTKFPLGSNYEWTIASNSSGEIKQYCEADLIN